MTSQKIKSICSVRPITLERQSPVAMCGARIRGKGRCAGLIERDKRPRIIVCTSLIRNVDKSIETPLRRRVKLLELRQVWTHVSMSIRFTGTPDQVIESLGVGFSIIYLQRR